MKDKKEQKITKDMIVNDIVEMGEEYQAVLLGFDMHCVGCPISGAETLEQASFTHEIDLDLLLEKLNEVYNKDKDNSSE